MRPIEGAKRRLWAITQKVFLCGKSSLEVYGDACQWAVVSGTLDSSSVVYSAGVGHDNSFEKALVEKFGCRVVLLDPSPKGIETMSKPENTIEGIEFLPVGLAEKDGKLSFSKQLHHKESGLEDVGTVQPLGTGYDSSSEAIRFPVRSLRSLMSERNHLRIDLLKIDIEGFEYEVLRSILKQHLSVTQICVEFHEFIPGIGYLNNYKALVGLAVAGYSLVSLKQHDHTFFNSKFQQS